MCEKAGSDSYANDSRRSREYKELIEEKLNLVVQASQIGLWDMDIVKDAQFGVSYIVTWSDEYRQILGYEDRNDFPDALASWRDRLHPDDKDKVMQALDSYLLDQTGMVRYDVEYRFLKKNGEYAYYHDFCKRMPDKSGGSAHIVGALTETTGQRRQGQLLQALNNAVASLLTTDDEALFETVLMQCMAAIGDCLAADRVQLWRNEMQDMVFCFVHQYEWLSEYGQLFGPCAVGLNFPYTTIPEWETTLSRNDCINGPVSKLSQANQIFLAPYGMKSIVVIPLFFHENFWGFFSIDDCRIERSFSEQEIDILRSAGLMMVSAFDRVKQTAVINEIHQRTRIMLDATPLCCTLFDTDIHCIDCNDEAVKLFQLKDKQEYLERFFDLFPEYQHDGQRSKEKARAAIKDVFQTGRFFSEWMHRLPDGTPVPVEVTLVRVRDGDSYVVAGFTRDLREHNRMMKDIEQRDVLFSAVNNATTYLLQAEVDEFESALWSSMGMMAYAVDADRVRLWRNHEENGELYCTQMYEWSEGAEPTQNTSVSLEVSYRQDLPGWEESLSRGQCINEIVSKMPSEEGSRFAEQGILSLLIVPVFLRDTFWGFVGFNDCHQERLFTKNEESILWNGSLLITNALLRNEMTQELASALEKARAASEAKGSFLSNMSHEIRTPLNAIVGMTMIGKSASNTERKDYAFEKIEEASSHLLGVINDILDMSKIEANKLELSFAEFNFEKMLQNVVNIIGFRINEKSQKLTVNLDPNIPERFLGDDQRLSQVLTNLLSNAIKFTPESGAITMNLHLKGEENGLCLLEITVVDTGIGISPDQQQRLFSSFEQAESSTSRKYGGTGLGLAISKRIVELMQGDLWVNSELGKGSTFGFTVKLNRVSNSDSALTADSRLQNIRMLVVDADTEELDYFKSLTQKMSLSCDTALTGEEALALLREEEPYDIYFVDWQMADMDAIELAAAIRARGVNEPVLAMISAYEWIAVEQAAIAAGIDGYLAKPIFPSSVMECLVNHISAKILSSSVMPEAEQTETYDGFRILLADDVEINREIVQALLEPTHIQIEYAANGVEVLQLYRLSPTSYDMIFMDIQMPEMDGYEATQLIRASGLPNAADIPIVAMTANVFKEDIERCLASGMNYHIGKPIDYVELMKKLKRYLKG